MKIICIGDSLTYGYGVWSSQCWVTLLAERINENRRSGIRCLNFGTNGDTSGYMLDRARRHIIPDKAEAGDIIIIMGGANDVLMYGADENDAANIINIADLAKSKNHPRVKRGVFNWTGIALVPRGTRATCELVCQLRCLLSYLLCFPGISGMLNCSPSLSSSS